MKEITPILNGNQLRFRTFLALGMNLQLRLKSTLAVNALDVDEGTGARSFHLSSVHYDLLHQALVEGFNGAKPVDDVVRVPVSSRVAKREEWPERADCVLRKRRIIDALWLVDDDDWLGGLNRLDRRRVLKTFLLFEYHCIVFTQESVDVNDEDLQRIRLRELLQLLHTLSLIDLHARGLVIEIAEMFGGDAEIFLHAFTDRNTRHHDDEL